MMRKAAVTLLIFTLSASTATGQRPAKSVAEGVSTLPELKLNVPAPIRLSRMVRFTLDPIVAPETANYMIADISVDWVVVQKSTSPDPLENDLVIDRLDGTEAYMPTGASPSVVSVNVTATLTIKDAAGNTHLSKIKTKQDVQFGNPIVDPTPAPVVIVDPIKPPAPVIVEPALTDGKYKLTTWTYKTLKDSRSQPAPIAITKAEAAAIGAGWHTVAQMTRNNPVITMEKVISNMAETNRNNAGKNLDNWITVFFEPVRQKLNSINRSVLSVADQAESYDEIGNGLEAWSKTP